MTDDQTTETVSTEEQTAPAEETKSFSQDEVNSLLAAEKRKIRSQYEDYEDLKARANTTGDLEAKVSELNEKLSASEKRASDAELSALRTRISADNGVPLSALTATDEESLTEQAKSLLEWRGESATGITRTAHGTGTKNTPGEKRSTQLIRDFANNN